MTILGVIPAAGNGSRWGGCYKELLPCGDGEWLLDRTAKAMLNGGADALLIVTQPDKVAAHAAHMAGKVDAPIYYVMQRGDNDIWSAIEESFDYPADNYLFGMPDTYFPLDAFVDLPAGHFGLGLFETNTPERFGVLNGRGVVNKTALPPGKYLAWGLLRWDSSVVETWKHCQENWPTPIPNYTDALNLFVYDNKQVSWIIPYYHDFATYADYQQWMANR